MLSRVVSLAALAAALTAPVHAAETEPMLFEQWRWTEAEDLPQSAGMAGVFLGMSEGFAAVVLSPSELALLVPREITVSSAGVSLAAKAGRVGLAAYVQRPSTQNLLSDGTSLAGSRALDGTLRVSSHVLGFAAGVPVFHDRLRFGAGLGLSTVRVRGGYAVEALDTRAGTRWGVDDRYFEMSGQASLVWDVSNHPFYGNTLRIGVAARQANLLRTPFERTLVDVQPGAPPTSRRDDARLPDALVVSVGAAVRKSDWMFGVQADTTTARATAANPERREWALAVGVEGPRIGAGLRPRLGMRRQRERFLADTTTENVDHYAFLYGNDHAFSYAVGLSWQRDIVPSLDLEPALHVDAVTLPKSFRVVVGAMVRF